MVILGIAAYFHDSSAALVVDGEVVAACCEERFTRVKHDKSFPVHAISFCIDKSALCADDVDYVVFYEKPLLKFERILSSHIYHAPKSAKTFLKAMPIWLKERLDMKGTITHELNRLFGCARRWDVRFVPHHISHAAMAYYSSGFNESALLVIDAVGEKATTSLLYGKGKDISIIKQQEFPNSIGLLYSSFTYFLGFMVNADEYKVMGLAPYGQIESKQTKTFIEIIEKQLVDISEDGSIILNQKYFTFMYGDQMVNLKRWEKIFAVEHREEGEAITQTHKNLAAAIQYVTEKIIIKLSLHIKEITLSDHLGIAGGCALNCAAMGKVIESGLFEKVYVPFSPGDEGGAIGCALYFSMINGTEHIHSLSPYLGPEFSDIEIEKAIAESGLGYHRYDDFGELYAILAQQLNAQKILGWFQSRMEFGPRALGNRSILADPRDIGMKDRVNSRVKYREAFRPFAPVVMQEDASTYFEEQNSSYMMFTSKVRKGMTGIPAVTHVDNTARIQTVSADQNKHLYGLLCAFKKITGCPILLNTSFNVMGEPIVCTPHDAVRTFLNAGIDTLVINNYILTK